MSPRHRSLPAGPAPRAELTTREADVVRGLARGLTYPQCALLLAVSVNTIRTHVRSIYAKLEACDKVQAVLTALERGLITLDDDAGERRPSRA